MKIGISADTRRASPGWGLLPLLLACAALPAACVAQSAAPGSARSEEADSLRLLADLRFLSSPSLEGRGRGTPGNEAARDYIETAFRGAGVEPLANSGYRQVFPLPPDPAVRDSVAPGGANVIGVVRGREHPGRFIVLTAHFDHLGVRGGDIYPGADDNASGSAALLEIARYFGAHQPRNSIIFAALDAEEGGLMGARRFVRSPPVPLDSIVLSINMDMIGRNDRRELFVAGTYHYPFLAPLVDEVAAASRLSIRTGHDRPDGSSGEDWTQSSDHGPFHSAGIPFLYFGVEDLADYHRPTDTFDGIQPDFYVEAVRSILGAVLLADARLEEIHDASARTR